jgi:hypothetical protein
MAQGNPVSVLAFRAPCCDVALGSRKDFAARLDQLLSGRRPEILISVDTDFDFNTLVVSRATEVSSAAAFNRLTDAIPRFAL